MELTMSEWTKERREAAWMRRAAQMTTPDEEVMLDEIERLEGEVADLRRTVNDQAVKIERLSAPTTDADVAEALRLSEAATPGPWKWWTSNSHRRLTSDHGRDGGVAYGTKQRDGCDDIIISDQDMAFVERARTLLPALARRCQAAESLVLAHEEQHAAQVAIEAEVRAAAQDYEARWKAAEASESRLTQQVEILAARSALTEARLAETIQEATDCTNEIVDLKRRLIDLLNDAAGAALAACEPGGAK